MCCVGRGDYNLTYFLSLEREVMYKVVDGWMVSLRYLCANYSRCDDYSASRPSLAYAQSFCHNLNNSYNSEDGMRIQ